VFIDISQLLGIVLYFEYKNCFIDSYGSINKNIINKNLTDIEFIMEDATRYSKIKDTESVSLSGTAYNEYKELFNNYMEELNKNKDIKIIIDSEELGLL